MDLARLWPLIEPATAVAWDREHLEEQIRDGDLMLFANADAAALVNLIDHPNGARDCNALRCVGPVDGIADLASRIEKFAAERGCDRVAFAGAPDWQDALPTYSPSQTIWVRGLR